jgi:acid phosphatase type 7
MDYFLVDENLTKDKQEEYISKQQSDTSTTHHRTLYQIRPDELGIRSVIRQEPLGNQKFQKLPDPTGEPPYHLSLDKILSANQINAIQNSGNILFHIVGDTGGVKHPEPQQIVEIAMEANFDSKDTSKNPAFFYHLGDVVYYFGEAAEYYPQFYEPYSHYSAPIFTIPGNHDGDIGQQSTEASLAAFVRNFCAKSQEITPDAGEITRAAMIQPNVYWTLEAPFVTLIGLYSNVPQGGKFEQNQIDWFTNELKTAPNDKALIVCVHHPPYSVDNHHSGSQLILDTLDNAFEQSGRVADIVFAAHVHNYQRFTRVLHERQIPYIVAGAGGYWNLHYMQKDPDGSQIEVPCQLPDADATLENYCDNRHGFMRIRITQKKLIGEYYAVSRPQESWRQDPERRDSFEIDLQKHSLTRSTIRP